jgi:hypothetical protein
MSDASELLRSLNPEPDCVAPPIEMLWARLELDAVSAPERENLPDIPPRLGRKTVRGTGRRSGRRTGRAWASGLLAGVCAAVAIAVGVGAVLVLHARPAGTGTARSGALPSSRLGVVGILGVLRRPQTKADLDLGPARRRLLHDQSMAYGIPVMSRLRLATITPWGAKVFLIPFLPPTQESIAKLPASLRHRLAIEQWRTGMRLGSFGAGSCCSTAAQIEGGQDWSTGGGGRGSLNYVILVVPDGVTRVTIDLSHPVSTQVHNNVAAFEVPHPIENLSVYSMTWYGSSGAVLKHVGSSIHHASARPNAPTRSSLISEAEKRTAQVNPSIMRNFALFATNATGTVGRGASSLTVSEPPLSARPTSVLEMDQGAASRPRTAGYGMAVRATREVTTSSGLQAWVQAGNTICITGTTAEQIDVCSGNLAGALASGLVVFPRLPDGTHVIFGIVPKTNQTITLELNRGGRRTVPVTDGMFITPADGVTQFGIKSVTGKTTMQPGLS